MNSSERLVKFVVTSLLAATTTAVIGFIFFQSAIFEINGSSFQFLTFGIAGGMIFSTFRFLSKQQAAFSIILLLVLDLVLDRSTTWRFMLRDAIYYFGITAAIFLFAYYFFNKLRGVLLARILVLGSTIALSYLAITIILYLVFLPSSNGFSPDLSQMIYFNLSQGFLIGLGIGIGIELAERALKRWII
jgi:hypothetical protein